MSLAAWRRVLDRAGEVKRKTYRESLQQNRDAVLLSKELVTIDSHVPVELNLAALETQLPDIEGCRELFTELEFTSMLRDLAPVAGGALVEIIETPTDDQIAEFYQTARESGFAFALDAAEPAAEDSEDEPAPTHLCLTWSRPRRRKTRSTVGVCAQEAQALCLELTPELRALLEDAQVPKQTHDWKLALHVLLGLGVELRGAMDDLMLLSYALNPTHATQALPDIAARHGQPAPTTVAAKAASICALVPALRTEVEKMGVDRIYREIDLPLAPVSVSMERAGVRIDKDVLASLSTDSLQRFNESSRVFSILPANVSTLIRLRS